MPAIKSAEKRVRTSEKARKRNISTKSRISSARRKVFEAFGSNDAEAGNKRYRDYSSVLDKAVKKGAIKRNTSIRRKKRAAAALAAMPAAAPPSTESPE